jgi:GntR family transcriptional regulator
MTLRQLQITDLPIRPVDAASPIPLYHQVEIDLQTLIQTGVVAPDDLLPPEIELSKLYGVGRQTIRMALSRLVANRSFTRQMAEMGMQTHSQVLHLSTGTIAASAPKPLRTYIGARCLHLTRLRYGNEQPIGLQYTTILTERCVGIERYDFNHESLYDVLAREYQLGITQITNTVTALPADVSRAELLAIAEGDTLLQVNTTAYLEDHEVIEANISYYRTDKYEFSITQTF